MNKEYTNEVKQKWVNTVEYNEYLEKSKNYSKETFKNITLEMEEIFFKFSKNLQLNINCSSEETQVLVTELKEFITKNFYTCTNDVLFGLGKMYINDERFKINIDKHCLGTAEYVNSAIEYYCLK